jgi:hypothetical protein
MDYRLLAFFLIMAPIIGFFLWVAARLPENQLPEDPDKSR